MLNVALDSQQVFLGNYLDIKSTTLRDTLRRVLEGVTYISLREDKPSVSTSLRMIATNSPHKICAGQSKCLIYLSTSAGGVPYEHKTGLHRGTASGHTGRIPNNTLRITESEANGAP